MAELVTRCDNVDVFKGSLLRIRLQDWLPHGCEMLPLLVPLTSCGQLHDDRSLFDAELLCVSLLLFAVPFPFPFPLSRCECDVLSRGVLSRRWLLLPRLFVGVMAAGVLPAVVVLAALCWDCVLADCDCDWPCFLLLTGVELLLSSEPVVPFCSDLTISCLPSDVFVPGLVRLILIFSP